MNLRQLKTKVITQIAELSNNGVKIPQQKNADYLLRVIPIANSGLNEIVTTAKRKTKSLRISRYPLSPLIGNFNLVQHCNIDNIQYCAMGVGAYYFETDNTATIYVEEEITPGIWNIIETIQNTIKDEFTAHKNLVNSNYNVRLRFSGPYLYNIRNVALFREKFETIIDIPDYTPLVKYKMPGDFFMIKNVMCEGDNRQYVALTDIGMQDQQSLLFDYYSANQIVVNYYAYPEVIPDDATDDYKIDIDQLGAEVLVSYVSSYVKNDEDIVMSTQLKNDYEEKLARLMNQDIYSTYEVINVNNW